MSKVALISDIHANAIALEEVIADAVSQGVEAFACLGDIVGYGPNPAECIERVQSLNCICVKGNHDAYIHENADLIDFNDQARLALEWTRERLAPEQKDWLSQLPYTEIVNDITLVHSSINEPERWEYVRNSLDAAPLLEIQQTSICFIGHTHRPAVYELRNGHVHSLYTGKFLAIPGNKYLINTGSVGQSRDGDTKASYVIFDQMRRTVEFRRVAYDTQKVADEIRMHGLPESLAVRLLEAS